LGVIKEMQRTNKDAIRGFDCTIKSNLPMGGGISSSAALECGIAKGLNELFELGKTDGQLIKLCRDAEHNFVGTECGIMDQFAVVMGKSETLIKLNCRTLEHSYIGADLGPFEILLLNTNVSHNLTDSEYNKRRAECAEALEIINGGHKGYGYLCDVPLETVLSKKLELPKPLFKRALYAVQENGRTLRAASFLENGDLEPVGELLYESHAGLSELYEVSCDELDFMVEYSKDFPEVIGSRMMGGGFGGCTINLVHRESSKSYIDRVAMAYYKEFNIELTPIFVKIGDGVSVIGE
ncbi:MAG: galactokinase, partial [Maribacter sp.]